MGIAQSGIEQSVGAQFGIDEVGRDVCGDRRRGVSVDGWRRDVDAVSGFSGLVLFPA